jgi:hypothetical protein
MKKLFVAAIVGLALVSCGGPSVCDCIKQAKEGKVDEKCQELEKKDAKAFAEEAGKCK